MLITLKTWREEYKMGQNDRSTILKTLLDSGEPFVVASIYECKTSSAVRVGDCFGMNKKLSFIGSAAPALKDFLTFNMKKCLRIADSFTAPFFQSREDAAAHGSTCGQRSSLLFQYFGDKPVVYVFGAGDLALATATIISIAGFSVTVLDNDSSFLNNASKSLNTQLIDFDDESSYPKILRKDFCLVMTRGHLQDAKVLSIVLKSNPRYIGMIGSDKKNTEVREELKRMNISDSHWKRIRTPVGLDIGASTPGEIAVAIAAEVVHVKNTENAQEDQ
ncbi:MAG TPA: hypothetical protein DCE14_01110 [Kosmotogaceae bacterium]|nr:MAG: Uncharacterized protein XE05_1261 [Thermotogales bacterium 46_20]HAA84937.1 hypothetical protein [Kosmotogaceae bacterium]